ncbi:hypothetical protein KR009_011889 [Drosophila setifemur]|nr:hypothetical protein KR009_011889 [Drosophila setifemur]
MDELMRQQSANGQKNRDQELTCSVHFIKPRLCQRDSSESDNELHSVTRLVANTEDLNLDRVFKNVSKEGFQYVESLNRSLFEFGHNFEDVNGWMKMAQPPKDQLSSVLRYTIESHYKTTVQIDINKMYFNCHLIVLQVYSRFFMELKEIPLLVTLPEDRVSQKAFMIIYKWMLSDEPILERQYIVEVFVAATYLRIDDLLMHCWNYFDDIHCFNEDSACILYVETQYHPALDVVRNLMLTRIQKILLTFVATSDFLDIPISHLIYLLSSSSICVNTEIEVLFTAVRWMGHDWNRRREFVLRIVSCIRFKVMPLWYLLYVRRDETHPLIKELLALDEVDRQINDAISSVTSRMYDEKLAGMDCSSAYIQQQEQSLHRRWICDKSCNYFHLIGCPNTREICYKNFENYLIDLQKCSLDHWSKVEMLDLENDVSCCSMRNPLLDDPLLVTSDTSN